MNRNDIASLLPVVFQRTLESSKATAALLDVMAAMHTPIEQLLDRVDETFNPYKTQDRFVEFLATWVDLDRLWNTHSNPYVTGSAKEAKNNRIEKGRLRELIAHASYLSQWRGTSQGMLLFLKIATGIDGFEIIEGAELAESQQPFHFVVRIPQMAKSKLPLIKAIIEQEKPVYTTFAIDYLPDETEGE